LDDRVIVSRANVNDNDDAADAAVDAENKEDTEGDDAEGGPEPKPENAANMVLKMQVLLYQLPSVLGVCVVIVCLEKVAAQTHTHTPRVHPHILLRSV